MNRTNETTAQTVKRLEADLRATDDPKRQAFLRATINRTLTKAGCGRRYLNY